MHARVLNRLSALVLFAALLPLAAGATDLQTALRLHQFKDYDKAFAAFMELAQAGDETAMANVGYYYDSGFAVARDMEEAVRWYTLAAEHGSVEAQFNLGALYEGGEGVPQDYGIAYKWFEMAAGSGDPMAAMYLGLFHEEGLGRPVDPIEAYGWFFAAAEAGLPDAIAKRDEMQKLIAAESLVKARALGERHLHEQAEGRDRKRSEIKL